MELKIKNKKENDTITLLNAEMNSFFSSYKPFVFATTLKKREVENSYPAPIEFEINDFSSNKNAYLFFISNNKDFKDFKKYHFDSSSFFIDNLYPGLTYYCKVKNITTNQESNILSFKTKNSPRTLRIDGVKNVRDIGGSKIGNEHIKLGKVYRGANLDEISKEGKEQFSSLGIKTIIDLREKNYRKKTLNNVNYIDLPDSGGPCYAKGDLSILKTELQKSLALEIKTFANEDNYPIYFHCQIGRDRTGTLSFILKGLLGVSYEELIKDYELSFFSTCGTSDYRDTLGHDLKESIESLYNFFLEKDKEKNKKNPTLKEGIELFLLEIGVSKKEISSIKKIMLGTK
ncbi:MAG TPA: hypothetical protein DD377_05270 [Firmicutes bacterium]|nr:hypothetical protein [Bacillota bacterium]